MSLKAILKALLLWHFNQLKLEIQQVEFIIEFCFNKNLLITHGPFDASQPSFVLSQKAFAIWTFVSHILHRINTTWNKATRPTPKKHSLVIIRERVENSNQNESNKILWLSQKFLNRPFDLLILTLRNRGLC